MSEQDLEKLLLALAEKYKAGSSSNSDQNASHHLIEIRHKLETIKNDIEKTDGKLDEIKEALYEPDKGIYRRMNSMHSDLEALKSVAGNNYEHLRGIIEQKKKNDKLWVVMVTAAVTGVIKTVWDVVSSLL